MARGKFLSGLFAGLLVTSLFASTIARAEAFPWVPFSRSDLRYNDTAEMDLAVRLDLIRRAKRTVDVVTFEQMFDENVGKPVLSALREAAERGVRVRFATATMASMVKDGKNECGAYLTNPPARQPVEFYYFGKGSRSRGLGAFSAVHEKILIVDGEIALATGRGHSSSYINWIDTSFVFRGPLVAQAAQAVNDVFDAVKRETVPFVGKKPPAGIPVPTFAPSPLMALDAQGAAELQNVKTWLDTPYVQGPVEGRARTLHHDYINQVEHMRTPPPAGDPRRSWRAFHDPVIDAMMERLPSAREVRFTTLSANQRPDFRHALEWASDRNHARVVIWTNGQPAALEPVNVPWQTAMADMINLVSKGVELWQFQPLPASYKWTYLHRKLAIIDDTVIFGSHNLNISSTTNNDEMSWEIENPQFASEMRDLFDRDMQMTSRRTTRAELMQDLDSATVFMPFGHLMMGTF